METVTTYGTLFLIWLFCYNYCKSIYYCIVSSAPSRIHTSKNKETLEELNSIATCLFEKIVRWKEDSSESPNHLEPHE